MGALLASLAPVLSTLVASGITYAANHVLGWIKDWSALATFAFYGAVGAVGAVLISALGGTLSNDPHLWTNATVSEVATLAVGAVIYRLGKLGTKAP